MDDEGLPDKGVGHDNLRASVWEAFERDHLKGGHLPPREVRHGYGARVGVGGLLLAPGALTPEAKLRVTTRVCSR